MAVLTGSMEENIREAAGAAPRWMPMEIILMESVSGESVLIPAPSTTVLTSCKHPSVDYPFTRLSPLPKDYLQDIHYMLIRFIH